MEKQLVELIYGASIIQDGESFLVTFHDLSNVFSCGETREEAIFHAQEALDGVLLEMVAEDLEIPKPSAIHANEYAISVSPEVATQVMSLMLRKKSRQKVVHKAQALGSKYQSL